MFILILGLAVIAMVICIIIVRKTMPKAGNGFSIILELSYTFGWLFGLVALVSLVLICCMASDVATESTIDPKITMYQQENAAIEQDIDRIVQDYLKHEHDTFTDLKTEESSITLVTLFPELKSDTLVQQQLEIYVANNAKIRSLREEKIDIAKLKWLLYFGK